MALVSCDIFAIDAIKDHTNAAVSLRHRVNRQQLAFLQPTSQPRGFLAETLRSASKQTYNLEGTLEICLKYFSINAAQCKHAACKKWVLI